MEVTMSRSRKKRLGELLLEAGVISPEDIEKALEQPL